MEKWMTKLNYKSKKKILKRHIFLFANGEMIFVHLPKKRARRKFIKLYNNF